MSGITVAPDDYFPQFNLDFSVMHWGESFVRSGTLFQVTYASGNSEEFRGEGLTYSSDGKLVSGKVTSYLDAELIAEVAETSS